MKSIRFPLGRFCPISTLQLPSTLYSTPVNQFVSIYTHPLHIFQYLPHGSYLFVRSFTSSTKTLYQILGVSKDASSDEIKRQYKKLALQHHPDRNPDNRQQAETRFREISEAYQTLSDNRKRSEYDRFGQAGTSYQNSNYNQTYSDNATYNMNSGSPFMNGFGNSQGFKLHTMSQKEAEELFRNIFGGQSLSDLFGRTHMNRGGPSPHFNPTSIFEDLFNQAHKESQSRIFDQPSNDPIRLKTNTEIIERNGRRIEIKRTQKFYRNGQVIESTTERDLGKSTSSDYQQTSNWQRYNVSNDGYNTDNWRYFNNRSNWPNDNTTQSPRNQTPDWLNNSFHTFMNTRLNDSTNNFQRQTQPSSSNNIKIVFQKFISNPTTQNILKLFLARMLTKTIQVATRFLKKLLR